MPPVQLSGAERRKWEESVIDDSRIGKSTQICVMYALLDCCQGKAMCWPSISYLAKKTRLTDRTVQTAIRGLIASEALAARECGTNRTNRILVVLSHPDAEAAMSAGVVEKVVARGVKFAQAASRILRGGAQGFHPKVGIENPNTSPEVQEEKSSQSAQATREPDPTDQTVSLVRELVEKHTATFETHDIGHHAMSLRAYSREIARVLPREDAEHFAFFALKDVFARGMKVLNAGGYARKLILDWRDEGLPARWLHELEKRKNYVPPPPLSEEDERLANIPFGDDPNDYPPVTARRRCNPSTV